jgi:hypothetical protein
MRLEECWEGRMNIVERGGAAQGRMGAEGVVFGEGEGEIVSEGGDGVG